jgi:hypothetical protein
MISSTSRRFWECYDVLPQEVRRHAKDAYAVFSKDPYHPSLHFKRVHSTRPIFSVRITRDYRAVGILDGDEITWFWIGSHADYNSLLKRMKST